MFLRELREKYLKRIKEKVRKQIKDVCQRSVRSYRCLMERRGTRGISGNLEWGLRELGAGSWQGVREYYYERYKEDRLIALGDKARRMMQR